MKLINSFLLLVSFVVFIYSCEESTDPDDTGTAYLPLAIGNYWIYDSYEKDIVYKVINTYEDSLIIERKERIQGTDVFEFVRYREGNRLDTMLFATIGKYIYLVVDSTKTYIPSLEKTWFKIIDTQISENNSWNVYSEIQEDHRVNIYDSNMTGVYIHTINATFDWKDTVTFNGRNYLAQIYSNKYDSKYEGIAWDTIRVHDTLWAEDSTTWTLDSTFSVDTTFVTYTRLLKYYDRYKLIPGVGFYSIARDPHTRNTSTNPSSPLEGTKNYNGTEMVLKRFRIQ